MHSYTFLHPNLYKMYYFCTVKIYNIYTRTVISNFNSQIFYFYNPTFNLVLYLHGFVTQPILLQTASAAEVLNSVPTSFT